MGTEPVIRPARPDDAERLAALAVQLGYPVDGDQVRDRLPTVIGAGDAAVLVAEARHGEAIGWLHVELKPSLLGPLAAQVMGLVVDESQRGAGIGAKLLDFAEAWARDRGCSHLLVATRISRQRAHEFYRRRGYTLLKTSHIFEKSLD